jgi:hypothetical protein
MTAIRGFIVGKELRFGVWEVDSFDRLRFREDGVKVQR